jgi:hypothetical protein
MTIVFFNAQTIAGVVTQGRADAAQWVTSYKVQTSTNCDTYSDVDGGKVFTANTDQGTLVRNAFSTPVQGVMCLRLLPQAWNGHISMRAAALLPAGAASSALAELKADPANVGFDEVPDMTAGEARTHGRTHGRARASPLTHTSHAVAVGHYSGPSRDEVDQAEDHRGQAPVLLARFVRAWRRLGPRPRC